MKEIVVSYLPFGAQKAVHDNPAKFKAVLTGVGFGKTTVLVNEVLRWAIEKPALYLIVAPTFPLLRDTTMREFYKFCPTDLIQKRNYSDSRVYLINGAEIIFRSGDNDRHIERIRGLTIGGFALDEVTLFPYLMWEIMIARLRDNRGVMHGIACGTPKGEDWTKLLFVDKADPKTGKPLSDPENYAFFDGSSMDNPYTSESYKQTLLNTYSGIFREQEIYGKFVSARGNVYPMFSRKHHIADCEKERNRIVRFIAGVDFGFTNPAVILAIGIDGDWRHYVFEEFYRTNVMDEEFIAKAKELKEKYRIQEFWCDPSEPMFIEKLNNAGCFAKKADNSILTGISSVTSKLEIKKDGKPALFIDHLKCPNMIKEMQSYRYSEKKDGKPDLEKPVKLFDHAADALRYAILKDGSQKFAFAFA